MHTDGKTPSSPLLELRGTRKKFASGDVIAASHGAVEANGVSFRVEREEVEAHAMGCPSVDRCADAPDDCREEDPATRTIDGRRVYWDVYPEGNHNPTESKQP